MASPHDTRNSTDYNLTNGDPQSDLIKRIESMLDKKLNDFKNVSNGDPHSDLINRLETMLDRKLRDFKTGIVDDVSRTTDRQQATLDDMKQHTSMTIKSSEERVCKRLEEIEKQLAESKQTIRSTLGDIDDFQLRQERSCKKLEDLITKGSIVSKYLETFFQKRIKESDKIIADQKTILRECKKVQDNQTILIDRSFQENMNRLSHMQENNMNVLNTSLTILDQTVRKQLEDIGNLQVTHEAICERLNRLLDQEHATLDDLKRNISDALDETKRRVSTFLETVFQRQLSESNDIITAQREILRECREVQNGQTTMMGNTFQQHMERLSEMQERNMQVLNTSLTSLAQTVPRQETFCQKLDDLIKETKSNLLVTNDQIIAQRALIELCQNAQYSHTTTMSQLKEHTETIKSLSAMQRYHIQAQNESQVLRDSQNGRMAELIQKSSALINNMEQLISSETHQLTKLAEQNGRAERIITNLETLKNGLTHSCTMGDQESKDVKYLISQIKAIGLESLVTQVKAVRTKQLWTLTEMSEEGESHRQKVLTRLDKLHRLVQENERKQSEATIELDRNVNQMEMELKQIVSNAKNAEESLGILRLDFKRVDWPYLVEAMTNLTSGQRELHQSLTQISSPRRSV